MFDPLTHNPPRLDQFGYNKDPPKFTKLNQDPNNILKEQVPLPREWTQSPALKTKSDLLALR